MAEPVFYCGRRKTRCRNLECLHKFTKAEHDLWTCPDCGEDRHCSQRVTEEGKACRNHGGRSPSGMAAPAFKHGRYSKALTGRYRERYEAAANDPDILELLPEIALLDTRIGQLLEQLEQDDPIGRLNQAQEAFLSLREAMAAGNTQRVLSSLESMDGILNQKQEPDRTWSSVIRLIDQRRRLVESQVRKEAQADLNLSAEAMILLAAVESAIYLHIQDRRIIQRIITELENIAGGTSSNAPALLSAG